jgi:hypothetical protein
MSTLVARLRSEIDEDVNEALDRLLDEAADRVAVLEMAFVEMLAKCSWAKREQWCGAIDCHCVLARRALRHAKCRAGQTQLPTRSTKRLNVRRGADMSPNIIFSIAAGLAYTLWVARIVEFATHMAPV